MVKKEGKVRGNEGRSVGGKEEAELSASSLNRSSVFTKQNRPKQRCCDAEKGEENKGEREAFWWGEKTSKTNKERGRKDEPRSH